MKALAWFIIIAFLATFFTAICALIIADVGLVNGLAVISSFCLAMLALVWALNKVFP